MNKNKLRSFKAAFGGIMAALSIVLMFSTGIIPTLTYAVPATCGALLMAVVIEIGVGFSTTIYIAVSILSLLVVADKEAAVMYVAFFGYYPIIKSLIEKKIIVPISWIIKYLIFNTAMIGSYYVVSKVFLITFDDIEFLGKYALWILLAIGNVVFLIYDIALTRLVSAYLYSWQKQIRKLFKN